MWYVHGLGCIRRMLCYLSPFVPRPMDDLDGPVMACAIYGNLLKEF